MKTKGEWGYYKYNPNRAEMRTILMERNRTEMEYRRKEKIPGTALAALIIAAAIFCGIYLVMRPGTAGGTKEITIEVVDKEQDSVLYRVKTDADYLRGALEETEGLTVEGTESGYGLMVETVNGLTADFDADGAYWAFYVDGAYCNYGVDEQPLKDGQAYRIVYTAQ